MSEVNIDAETLRRGDAAFSQTEEKLVKMSNGCICCTLREDFMLEVTRLAKEGRFDALLIESTGVSEPMPTRYHSFRLSWGRQPRRFRPSQTMTRQTITPAMPHITHSKNHLLPQSARGITQPNRMGRTRHKHAHKICRCKYIAINKKGL